MTTDNSDMFHDIGVLGHVFWFVVDVLFTLLHVLDTYLDGFVILVSMPVQYCSCIQLDLTCSGCLRKYISSFLLSILVCIQFVWQCAEHCYSNVV